MIPLEGDAEVLMESNSCKFNEKIPPKTVPPPENANQPNSSSSGPNSPTDTACGQLAKVRIPPLKGLTAKKMDR